MAFLYPTILFALAAIAIPVTIHLFNFRRYKTVYFTNTRFLKEVKEQTDSRSKIKHLLILLCRILTIVFLVIAFAQPYIKKGAVNEVAGKKTIGIYIDNSFSMGQTVSDVPLVELAKKKATEIVGAYADDALFQILTNEFEGKQQRFVDKQEALSQIREIQLSSSVQPLSRVMQRQKEALQKGSGQRNGYLISDFQKSFADVERLEADSSVSTTFVPLIASAVSNLYIDTCWFQSPVQIANQLATMFVKMVNSAPSAVDGARITLKVNGKIKAIKEFSIDANGIKIDTLSFTISESGWNKAEVSIIDHPVTFDDNYFVSFKVEGNENVMIINGGSNNLYLNAIFAKGDFFRLSNVAYNQLNYAEIFKNQFVILNELPEISTGLASQLKLYLEKGGIVCFFPGATANMGSYNSFLQSIGADIITAWIVKERNVSTVNTNDDLFKNVFQQLQYNIELPVSSAGFSFSTLASTNAMPLLTNSDGSVFVQKYLFGKGIFYLSSVPADKQYSNLPLSALFAPMVYNMSISKAYSNANAFIIGSSNMAVADVEEISGESLLKLRKDNDEFIPEQRKLGSGVNVYIGEHLQDAGFYSLENENKNEIAVFALNFNRKESDPYYVSREDLKRMAQPLNIGIIQNTNRNLGQIMTGQKLGLPLWKVSIIFVLIFIALEITLIKLWK